MPTTVTEIPCSVCCSPAATYCHQCEALPFGLRMNFLGAVSRPGVCDSPFAPAGSGTCQLIRTNTYTTLLHSPIGNTPAYQGQVLKPFCGGFPNGAQWRLYCFQTPAGDTGTWIIELATLPTTGPGGGTVSPAVVILRYQLIGSEFNCFGQNFFNLTIQTDSQFPGVPICSAYPTIMTQELN